MIERDLLLVVAGTAGLALTCVLAGLWLPLVLLAGLAAGFALGLWA